MKCKTMSNKQKRKTMMIIAFVIALIFETGILFSVSEINLTFIISSLMVSVFLWASIMFLSVLGGIIEFGCWDD